MARGTTSPRGGKADCVGANLIFEAELFKAADKARRGNSSRKESGSVSRK
jgi:hypothetical protein